MVVLTVVAVGFSFTQTPLYEASIKILIKQQQGSGDPGNLGSNVQGLQQLTQTMASAVKSSHVADRVAQELDGQIDAGELLGDRLRVDQIGQTQFMQVSSRDPSPERARRVVDTIGDVFSEDVSQVNPNATATVWDRAATPNTPISPKPLRNGLLALGLGLGLGVVLAFLLEYLDVSRRSPEKAQADAKTPDVGD
jgi:capsular polysaccharide biosynthesis protein